MTARAVIKGRESVDELTVPVTAIRSDSEGSYVYVKEGADVKKTYVLKQTFEQFLPSQHFYF